MARIAEGGFAGDSDGYQRVVPNGRPVTMAFEDASAEMTREFLVKHHNHNYRIYSGMELQHSQNTNSVCIGYRLTMPLSMHLHGIGSNMFFWQVIYDESVLGYL